MLYFPDSLLDQWLLEDIGYGDLTTRSLQIHNQPGSMQFALRRPSRSSGVAVAWALLKKLDLELVEQAEDGSDLEAGAVLLRVRGTAGRLHQGWKVAQNILEWSCGVAEYAARLLEAARKENPDVCLACTRKSIPGTKLLAQSAVLHGGAILHRGGTAETLLLFNNHRSFFSNPTDWTMQVKRMRAQAPEKKIVVEVKTQEEALLAISSGADSVQLDKFSPEEITAFVSLAAQEAPSCLLIAAGGITLENIADFARTKVPVLVTSAPYYAQPAEVKVTLTPVLVSLS